MRRLVWTVSEEQDKEQRATSADFILNQTTGNPRDQCASEGLQDLALLACAHCRKIFSMASSPSGCSTIGWKTFTKFIILVRLFGHPHSVLRAKCRNCLAAAEQLRRWTARLSRSL